ncbi:hypothetical protein GE21DRAFT_4638 [Neurospora crassa]|uniref:Uncharacterized protein n=1 Tax=Neurospora crassa (strain ATCC 24698 / 74-OR23-1A / CBS 708.71 / DSM 1257 / FGSC 987) TaxID=367110 RepID=Q7RZP2_NEUCR|nr:hypothetical protein NCU00322 [Neurospora crassa OR74A]EAA28557.2 hypothetical protein NCU00322 [Neurospora crassa OR74A]KHE89569.1 hypothetical protein GE21DRAFT_4638 [Neurospora crassa]|eukprot:XP_957793.2 hypothetical protein NCU00322 [Neurospora crassa OR74A]
MLGLRLSDISICPFFSFRFSLAIEQLKDTHFTFSCAAIPNSIAGLIPSNNKNHKDQITIKMKFSAVLVALAPLALAQNSIPQSASSAVASLSSSITSALASQSSAAASVSSSVNSKVNSISTSAESAVASVTSEAGDSIASLNSQLATATGSDRASITSALASLASDANSAVNSITSEAASAASSVTSNPAAPMRTGAVAMGALFGGAAVLAQL